MTKVYTRKKRQAFLRELARTGIVSKSADAVGISRQITYDWREKDAEFAAAMDDAMERAADQLEGEARRRAIEGVDEPVFYEGEQVATVKKYSDTLLIFLLKGRRKAVFAERIDHDHKGNVTLTFADLARAAAPAGE